MIDGLTTSEIRKLADQFKDAVARSVRYRMKAEQYTAAAVEAEKEAGELQGRIEKLARDSQHEVSFDHIDATVPSHSPCDTNTPPLPQKKA